jgi:hypothetical protein
MRRVLLICALTLVASIWDPTAQAQRRLRFVAATAGGGDVDLSEYRTATYGSPDHYCDFTKSVSGDGTLGDPWTPAQCKSEPVCGEVIGVIDVGSGATGTIQQFATASLDYQEPAFRPTNAAVQGSSCGSVANGVVYVARYPAITMVDLTDPTSSTIGTNADRTEIRHDGVADSGDPASPAGAATMGCYNQSYVTFDGFYIDMAQNGQSGDQGTLAAQADPTIVNDCRFYNFAIKGTTTDMDSNAVIWRPGSATRSVLSNFAVWDFDNEPTGTGLNQDGLFSDSYGDQDFLIEHFLLDGVERGIYTKGAPMGRDNYGTIRYGIVRNTGGAAVDSAGECIRLSALNGSGQTTVHNVLLVNCEQTGIRFSAEGGNIEELLIHHVTVANQDSGCAGALDAQSNITGVANFVIQDSIFDIAAACSGHMIDAGGSNAWATNMNHNAYFDADGVYTWSFNGAEQTSLADWRTATGLTETGSNTITDPFISRTAGNANYYRISGGHAALTMSSTSGEVGAYGGTSETIGPITQ